MKPKHFRSIFIVTAAVFVLCSALFICDRETTFSAQCPAVENGTFQAWLYWDGFEGDQPPSLQFTDEALYEILSDATLQRGSSFRAMPSPAIEITVIDEAGSWDVNIGADGSITIAEYRDLTGTRTFWKDTAGTLFDALYQRHLAAGGEKIPGYTPK